MVLPPGLGVVLGLLKPLLLLVLLVTSCEAAHRPPLAAQLTSGTNDIPRQDQSIRDCSDLGYGSPSGVYMIMGDLLTPNPVYCDMDDGEGWTVFQRRADLHPRQSFFLNWESYKWGFGTLDEEFWWGLHFLWQLTSKLDRVYELRVDLWDWEEETRYATYQHFTIASETDGYRLNFTDYAGDAGDALDYHNGRKFTTIDRDNDEHPDNCAAVFTGAWWYGPDRCYDSNLNGVYSPDTTDLAGVVVWYQWKGWYYSMNATTMKIRPTKKL